MGRKKELEDAFRRGTKISELIGEKATLWETAFITNYVIFMEENESVMSMAFHVKEGRKLMQFMLENKLVSDKSFELAGDLSVSEDAYFTTLLDIMSGHALENDKNNGNYKISKACGAIGLKGVSYEIQVVLNPVKKEWLGESNNSSFHEVKN